MKIYYFNCILVLICTIKSCQSQDNETTTTELDTEVALEWISITRALMRELYSLKVSPNSMMHRRASLFSNPTPVRFLALVQTGNKVGDDVLTARDLIKHSKVMEQLKLMNINLFGENWALNDLCLNFPSPVVNGTFGDLVTETLQDLVGCIIATPLDCFWEGSKVVGPNPPLEISEDVHSFIPSIPLGSMTWSNFNPDKVFEDLNKIVPVPKIQGLMKVAGVGKGYMNRLCVDPLDADCPESAPNYFDICHLVEFFLKKVDPGTNLTAKYTEESLQMKLDILDGKEGEEKKEEGVETSTVGGTETNITVTNGVDSVEQNTSETTPFEDNTADTGLIEEVKTYEDYPDQQAVNARQSKGARRVVRQADDYPEYETYSDYGTDSETEKMIKQLKADAQKVCDARSENVRLLLRRNPSLFAEYFRKFSWPQYPKYGKVMEKGCSGFASNLLKWRAARIFGNIKRKPNDQGITAEALQTFIKFPTAEEIYLRYKDPEGRRKKKLNRRFWSRQRAQIILSAWTVQAMQIISRMPHFTALKMIPS